MNRLVKVGIVVVALVAVTAAVLVAVDVLQDRRTTVSITGRVPFYADWDLGPRHQVPVGEIGPSKSIKVLRVRYGKDFEAIKVPTGEGQTGWVFSGANVHLAR